jgi:putative tryptophan/tyrosine transport system substrate-binding protein
MRREFIAGLAGAAAWPLVARAQQSDRVRRIGVLVPYKENDPDAKAQLSALKQALAELGWADGRNMQMDVRWAAGDVDRMRVFAKELVGLQPDVIFASNTPVTTALQRETRTIPIVFVVVSDPVGEGFVAGLPHPGGNLTGFIFTEAEMAGKSLELLTEIAPGVKRVASMFNPDTAPSGGSYYLPKLEAAARSLKVVPITAPVRSDPRPPSSPLSFLGGQSLVVVVCAATLKILKINPFSPGQAAAGSRKTVRRYPYDSPPEAHR